MSKIARANLETCPQVEILYFNYVGVQTKQD